MLDQSRSSFLFPTNQITTSSGFIGLVQSTNYLINTIAINMKKLSVGITNCLISKSNKLDEGFYKAHCGSGAYSNTILINIGKVVRLFSIHIFCSMNIDARGESFLDRHTDHVLDWLFSLSRSFFILRKLI